MTLAPLSTADPRLPGNRYGGHTIQTGGAPRDYGKGRVCSCGHVLSRYNPGPLCHQCEREAGPSEAGKRRPSSRKKHAKTCAFVGCGRAFEAAQANARYCSDACRVKAFKQRQKSGPSDSAHGEAVANAAPAARTEKEAEEMAAGKQRKTKEREAKIRELLADGEWHHARACAEAAGLGVEYAKKILQGMVEEGQLESGGRGGKGYRLRGSITDVKTHDRALSEAEVDQSFDSSSEGEKSAKPAPATPPAPAPDPPREHPPDAAASDPQTPLGPPASGEHEYTAASPEDIAAAMQRASSFGGRPMTVDWFKPKIGRVQLSEFGVLEALERLDDAARARLLRYAADRWPW